MRVRTVTRRGKRREMRRRRRDVGEEEGGSGHGDAGGVVTAAKWRLRHGRVDHKGECV
jgi:hypothetical protein